MSYFKKSPEGLDYWTIDWTDDLSEAETVQTTQWTVDAPINVVSTENQAKQSTIYVDGGADGNVYKLACLMTTNTGRRINSIVFLGVHP